ncbi:Protein phosphatase 1, partial [Globisporangium splendens]
MRLADPHGELPIKNFKYVKNCIEMYLFKRGIQKLAHFEPFVNLEVLWINENELEDLDGLSTCVRIKYTYAQNNRIRNPPDSFLVAILSTLEGSSLLHFTFLKELRLYDNKLKDLHGTLAILSKLHHLEDLDLFGNPVCEEDQYRLQVIHAIPSLVILDRHMITDEERAKAQRFARRRESEDPNNVNKDEQRKRNAAVVAGAPPQEMSGTVKMLFKEVAPIKCEQQARDRQAAERELLELSNSQKLLLSSQSSRSSSNLTRGIIDNLDEWEFAVLQKRFHAMEEKKHSGIKRDDVGALLAYLSTRGYAIFCQGAQLHMDSHAEVNAAVMELFPNDDKVTWAALLQCLGSLRLRCAFLSVDEIRRNADACFKKVSQLQQSTKDIHELSQQAYHLQALAETATKTQSTDDTSHSTATHPIGTAIRSHHLLSATGGAVDTTGMAAPKTKYYVASYARESSTTSPVSSSPSSLPYVSKFHELKEQSAQVDSALAFKYKLQQKVRDPFAFVSKRTHEQLVLGLTICFVATAVCFSSGPHQVSAPANASFDETRQTPFLHVKLQQF